MAIKDLPQYSLRCYNFARFGSVTLQLSMPWWIGQGKRPLCLLSISPVFPSLPDPRFSSRVPHPRRDGGNSHKRRGDGGLLASRDRRPPSPPPPCARDPCARDPCAPSSVLVLATPLGGGARRSSQGTGGRKPTPIYTSTTPTQGRFVAHFPHPRGLTGPRILLPLPS